MAKKVLKEKRHIFVIMPFTNTPSRDKDDLTEFFDSNLKEPIESATSLKHRYIVKRSDDTFEITPQIIRDVYNADIVLCDLSGHEANPNVMYELGVRLSISNKPVILFREEDKDNKPIFDIQGFYAFRYRPQQYRKLEEHILDKLRKYETGDETYESPVLRILKTDPTIVKELNRTRVSRLLASATVQVESLQRALGGAIHRFLSIMATPHEFKTTDEALEILQEHEEGFSKLRWDKMAFQPNSLPAIQAYLSELPLIDLIPEHIERRVNTFMNEYHGTFFLTNVYWNPTTYHAVRSLMAESFALRLIMTECRTLLHVADETRVARAIKGINEAVDNSELVK